MGLIDNQVPNPSATVPCEKIWVGRRELNPHEPQSQCGALPLSYDPQKGRQVNERDMDHSKDVVTFSIRPKHWQLRFFLRQIALLTRSAS